MINSCLVLSLISLLLMGCIPTPNMYNSALEQKKQYVLQQQQYALNECQSKFDSGKLKTRVALAKCINPKFLAILQDAGEPDIDLLEALNAKRLEVAERVDKKKITVAKGNVEINDYLIYLNGARQRRSASIAAQKLANTQKLESAGQGFSDISEALTRSSQGENYFQVKRDIENERKGIYRPVSPSTKCVSEELYGKIYTNCK